MSRIKSSVPSARAGPETACKSQNDVDNRGDEEMKLEEIRELILLLEQTTIAELELQTDDFKISLRKAGNYGGQGTVSNLAGPVVSRAVTEGTGELTHDENIVAVKAPMVGTFYGSASPDAEPYVKIGDQIRKGQTLCIVEAMKLMNEIKAELDGVITAIIVDNGQAVEYDQVLFLIKKD
jgi:oxaloacetate decarboxylase alpha subunit